MNLGLGPYSRTKGHFTKRKNSSKKAHPLIRKFVLHCEADGAQQIDVAARSGVHRMLIGDWETGNKVPQLGNFEAVVNSIQRKLVIRVRGRLRKIPAPNGHAHPLVLWAIERRQALGLTRAQVAARAPIVNGRPVFSEGSIVTWERGCCMPTLAKFDGLVRALGGVLDIAREEDDV